MLTLTKQKKVTFDASATFSPFSSHISSIILSINHTRKKEKDKIKILSIKKMALKDTFYISHGSPTLSIDESIPARKFLEKWKKDVFEQRPTSILIISGHWDTAVPTVNVIQTINDTIYDFYGFPRPMYQVFFFFLFSPPVSVFRKY